MIVLVGCDDEQEVAYSDGTRWENIMPLSPGRILPRDFDERQWSTFVTQSGIQADRTVKSFTPTWTGFSSDPTGEISYLDFGAIVMLWNESGADITGTSNDTQFSWAVGSLPDAIVPTQYRVGQTIVIDGGGERSGAFSIDNTGLVQFSIANTTGDPPHILFDGAGFAGAGVKGLPAGWLITYPK